jgi:hypothetical protein
MSVRSENANNTAKKTESEKERSRERVRMCEINQCVSVWKERKRMKESGIWKREKEISTDRDCWLALWSMTFLCVITIVPVPR